MRNVEFIALCAANTNKTARIRTYSGPWYTGASRIPDALSNKIGKVVALVQDQLDKGKFCTPNECLLIYNFQPMFIFENNLCCSLDMVIKPLADIHQTSHNVGEPFQLVVDGNTHQVFNMTKAMLDIGLTDVDEIEEEHMIKPQGYGNYMSYQAPCCFAAITSYRPIKDVNQFFTGELDSSHCVKECVAFDSSIEARNYLSNQKELGRYVAEITGPKEDVELFKTQGLSKQILKIINFFNHTVAVNSNDEIRRREDRIGDELERLNQVFHMS